MTKLVGGTPESIDILTVRRLALGLALRVENDPRGPQIGVFEVLDISGGQTWLPNK